jgi:signal transduction histidine kinase
VTYFRDQEARREHLVSTLSHELGTPITSLRMAIDLLQQSGDQLDPEQRELLSAAHDDVVRLQDLARRFFDLALSRTTAIAVDRSEIDVAAVLDRVERIFAEQAREKDVSLETSSEVVGPMFGDETKLSWALSNLTANALRYTPRGGKVSLRAAPSDGCILLSVGDTGPRIPPDQQERVFERYARSAQAGDAGGGGLGLAIVRDIVQAHGGRIRLESAPGQGTLFTLELPRR